jgi:transposase
MEVLAAYSHLRKAADLLLCHTVALTNPAYLKPSAKRPGSLRDRLDERDIAGLITAYRAAAPA